MCQAFAPSAPDLSSAGYVAGAMSVDWHPQHSSLLAVGCYNGSVHVFDVRLKGSTPLYSSIPVNTWPCPKTLL